MINKNFQLISRLSSYKGWYILFRILAVSSVAMGFMLLAANMIAEPDILIPLSHFFVVVLVFNIVTELNVLLDNVFERFFPVPSKIGLRVLLHFALSLFIGFLTLVFFESQIQAIEVLQQPITWLMMAFGLIFVFILIVISISLRIITRWIAAQKEVEYLRELQMKNDYNALQDQLNPHFLFNNLSILKSMIQYDPQAATAFTQHFTDTYRYVLQHRDHSTVQLSEELDFLHAYLAVHKERLGSALQVEYQVDKHLQDRNIPPFSMQLLIENAIKHNIVSKQDPLTISIFTENGFICVENNFQPKKSSYSTSKGLDNLRSRYDFLTEQKVKIIQNKAYFRVDLPLL